MARKKSHPEKIEPIEFDVPELSKAQRYALAYLACGGNRTDAMRTISGKRGAVAEGLALKVEQDPAVREHLERLTAILECRGMPSVEERASMLYAIARNSKSETAKVQAIAAAEKLAAQLEAAKADNAPSTRDELRDFIKDAQRKFGTHTAPARVPVRRVTGSA